MGIAGKKNRQWLLPTLIVLGLIVVLGLFLPGLIYPNQAEGNQQPLANTVTPTSTDTPTQALVQADLPTPVDSLLAVTAPPSPSIGNCTYSFHYWRKPGRLVDRKYRYRLSSYDQAQAIAILESNELDAGTLLLQQFFAALLNSLSGTDAAVVQGTLVQASDWISAHPSESLISEADRALALTLIQSLTDYNIGVSGPGHCPDEPFTPTPVSSPTPTQTPTRTPAPISTRRPVTPTNDNGGGGGDGGGGPTEAPTEPQPTDQPTEPPNPTDQPTEPPKPTDKPTPKPTDRPTPPVPTPEPPTDEPPRRQNHPAGHASPEPSGLVAPLDRYHSWIYTISSRGCII
jgi:hypothetical protein